ncbi:MULTISPECIES: hypothetical protein [Nostocales]|nr:MULTISPECIES: hypothetical protein [Nostocales]UYD38232.1 hypothetical protein HG267_36750 [Tolypothrix sp. PCC 7601]
MLQHLFRDYWRRYTNMSVGSKLVLHKPLLHLWRREGDNRAMKPTQLTDAR